MRDKTRFCTCWASLVLKASLSNSTAAEGSTNLRVEPTMRANRHRSSCMKARFLLSCQSRMVIISLDMRDGHSSWDQVSDGDSQNDSYTSPESAQTGGS